MTITKKTTLLEKPVKAQTSDGVAKVYSVKDGASEIEFHAGNSWTVEGKNLDLGPSGWHIDAAMVAINGTSCGLTYGGGPDNLTLYTEELRYLDPGEYRSATLLLYMAKEETYETLSIPLDKVIVG